MKAARTLPQLDKDLLTRGARSLTNSRPTLPRSSLGAQRRDKRRQMSRVLVYVTRKRALRAVRPASAGSRRTRTAGPSVARAWTWPRARRSPPQSLTRSSRNTRWCARSKTMSESARPLFHQPATSPHLCRWLLSTRTTCQRLPRLTRVFPKGLAWTCGRKRCSASMDSRTTAWCARSCRASLVRRTTSRRTRTTGTRTS
mmetsp:Transcript_1087/g.4313  ORF Transcript_1087/g.4313 Transcript_1087/m.4313 type:complete len:200 (+) Transcript_1087:2055-2654(+)